MEKLQNDMELLWTDNQKDLQKAKTLEKMVKAKNTAMYTQKLLQMCKSCWAGGERKEGGGEWEWGAGAVQ